MFFDAHPNPVARRILALGETRLELLDLEVQEARDNLKRAVVLACWMIACGALAFLMFAAAAVLWLWGDSPILAFAVLGGLCGIAGLSFYSWLRKLLNEWKPLSATLNQLRKDRACLQKILN